MEIFTSNIIAFTISTKDFNDIQHQAFTTISLKYLHSTSKLSQSERKITMTLNIIAFTIINWISTHGNIYFQHHWFHNQHERFQWHSTSLLSQLSIEYHRIENIYIQHHCFYVIACTLPLPNPGKSLPVVDSWRQCDIIRFHLPSEGTNNNVKQFLTFTFGYWHMDFSKLHLDSWIYLGRASSERGEWFSYCHSPRFPTWHVQPIMKRLVVILATIL